MITMSEFEVRMHAKAFVEIYLRDGALEAGKYGVKHLADPITATEEDLLFWQGKVKEEFLRQGFTLEKDEDGHVEAEAKL